jgi:hypothetical protein
MFADIFIQEYIIPRVCLAPRALPRLQLVWISWSLYFAVANASDFEKNYLNAWRRRNGTETTLKIFLGNQNLDIPLPPHDSNDERVFQELNEMYRYLKAKRGWIDIVYPRELIRIDCVQVRTDTFTCFVSMRIF